MRRKNAQQPTTVSPPEDDPAGIIFSYESHVGFPWPIPYDPAWEAEGDEPVLGLRVFGPITREDRTPFQGDEGADLALDRACTKTRGLWEGSAVIWQSPRFHTGRCVKLYLRFTDHDGGARLRDKLEEAFRHYGFMTKRAPRRAVDHEFYGKAERWL